MALTPAGDVVAAGYLRQPIGTAFSVLKFAGASGSVLWQQDIRGFQMLFDAAFDVAVDSAGNVIAAGVTQNFGPYSDFTVVKLAGFTGLPIWQQLVVGTANGGSANRVAIDQNDDVIAVGTLRNAGTSGDFAVVKLSGALGVELWRATLNGTNNGVDRALAVAVDGNGDVVAGGVVENTVGTTWYDFAVAKFSGATGAVLWRQELDGSGTTFEGDRAHGVAIDSQGDAIVAGRLANAGTLLDYVGVKFSGATGAPAWVYQLAGSSSDEAFRVATDSHDDVVVGGYTYPASGAGNITIVKLAGQSGTQVWRQDVAGTDAARTDLARGLALDGSDNVAVAGGIGNLATAYDFLVMKLAGSDGTEICREEVTSTGFANDLAMAVAVDAAGRVFASGGQTNPGTLEDWLVGRYCAVCGDGIVDPGEECDGGPCCADCQLAAATTVCRPASGPCDIPEYCTGNDGACPLDAVVANGSACDDADPATCRDQCLDGACVGLPDPLRCVDHFLCYAARTPRQTFGATPVTIEDRFGAQLGTVRGPNQLCTPVDKNKEDATAPTHPDHLLSYPVETTLRTVSGITAVNQFGTVALTVAGPTSLLVPAAKDRVGRPDPPAAPAVDHFACYRVDPPFPPTSVVRGLSLVDQFGATTGTVIRPVRLCAPANKNNETPEAPAHPTLVLCYRTKANFRQIGLVFAADQFGQPTLQPIRIAELCIPSLVSGP